MSSNKWEFDVPKYFDFSKGTAQSKAHESWFNNSNISGPSFPSKKRRRPLRIFKTVEDVSQPTTVDQGDNKKENVFERLSRLDTVSFSNKRISLTDVLRHNGDQPTETNSQRLQYELTKEQPRSLFDELSQYHSRASIASFKDKMNVFDEDDDNDSLLSIENFKKSIAQVSKNEVKESPLRAVTSVPSDQDDNDSLISYENFKQATPYVSADVKQSPLRLKNTDDFFNVDAAEDSPLRQELIRNIQKNFNASKLSPKESEKLYISSTFIDTTKELNVSESIPPLMNDDNEETDETKIDTTPSSQTNIKSPQPSPPQLSAQPISHTNDSLPSPNLQSYDPTSKLPEEEHSTPSTSLDSDGNTTKQDVSREISPPRVNNNKQTKRTDQGAGSSNRPTLKTVKLQPQRSIKTHERQETLKRPSFQKLQNDQPQLAAEDNTKAYMSRQTSHESNNDHSKQADINTSISDQLSFKAARPKKELQSQHRTSVSRESNAARLPPSLKRSRLHESKLNQSTSTIVNTTEEAENIPPLSDSENVQTKQTDSNIEPSNRATPEVVHVASPNRNTPTHRELSNWMRSTIPKQHNAPMSTQGKIVKEKIADIRSRLKEVSRRIKNEIATPKPISTKKLITISEVPPMDPEILEQARKLLKSSKERSRRLEQYLTATHEKRKADQDAFRDYKKAKLSYEH